jgi:replicative DNA helicase
MIKDLESIPTVLEYPREEDFYFKTHRLWFLVLYKVWEEKDSDWDNDVKARDILRHLQGRTYI